MAQIVTITNPLTGQPAQVDQLEHTAQQIDDAIDRAKAGGEIDQLLAGKPDSSSVYSKTETDALLATKVNGGKKTGWVRDTSAFSRYGVAYCRDDDGTVHVNAWNSILIDEVSAWSSAVICTLPEGFRPEIEISTPMKHSYNKCAMITIKPDGQVIISTGGDTVSNSTDIAFSISFPSV